MDAKYKNIIAATMFAIALPAESATLNLSDTPLFLSEAVSPMTMIVLGRNHKLYYEAYNNAMDLNNNGVLDSYEITYSPDVFDYYGYFDSYKCYSYGSSQFTPTSTTTNKKCGSGWSGDFLNYVTTSRVDALRKVLYGGYRSTDSSTETVLERSHIPQDAHSWGIEYKDVATNGYNITEYTPLSMPTGSNRHLFANTTRLTDGAQLPRMRVAQNINYRIWEWVSIERPVADSRVLHGGSGPSISGSITDYIVRVKVCVAGLLESNCQQYPNGNYKPIGILQEFGENDAMYFGLLTGSYNNNTEGGVLRKNMGTITDEINSNTGQLTTSVGIIRTIDRIQTTGFIGGYQYDCSNGSSWPNAWITTRPMNNGECRNWGNPIGEMMYETLRYFAGKGSATGAFATTGGTDGALGLPAPAWDDPYASPTPWCAKPNMLVISDVNPSYDSNSVPGSNFSGFGGDLSGFNANALGQTIWTQEKGGSSLHFIGQVGGTYDGAPTAKTVSSFGNIRGLSPEEPTKEGSYYSASAAYYGRQTDIHSAEDDQKVYTFAIALASPLPEIKIQAGNNTITMVPFAKSVGGCLGINGTEGLFQPTNTIVDFYVESLTPTSGVFRINFEDVEQGADHDMDAIARYTYTVNGDNTVTITVDSTYAAGCVIQHMGYIISGTTADGLYLEVRDVDTSEGADPDYFLDTPDGQWHPNPIAWNDGPGLPLTHTRTFTPGANSSAATLLKNPLWYAAKWGSFNDTNDNNKPDLQEEFDEDGDGIPDNYFLVTNAGNLSNQLATAFSKILDRSGSFSSASLNSGFLNSTTKIYQAVFKTQSWQGELLAYTINQTTGDIETNGSGPNGSLWDAGVVMSGQDYDSGRVVLTYKPSGNKGIPFRWPSNPASPATDELDVSQTDALDLNPVSGTPDGLGEDRLNWLRGESANEQQNGGTLRDRETPLADIIHSSPLLIGKPSFNYPDEIETESYASFRTTHLNRTQVVYVGTNGGTLEAFDATTGMSLLTYVPSTLYSKLNLLTNPTYTHKYYVDGSPVAVDVNFNSAWHTVLVGSLKAGGQGLFALNITNPASFSEASAESIVLWEFNDTDDADLGFTFSEPSIVKMANGDWAAIVGNGYNNTVADGNASTTGNAVLYIINIETGAVLAKIDTEEGMAEDPLGNNRPNGLSTPTVVDQNGDYVADYVYAGDIFGNVWKFDLTSSNKNQWDVAIKQGSNPQPLFTATDSAGNHQPITASPIVARVPDRNGEIYVFVGTGKYIEASDKTDMSVQSVYGLIDPNDDSTISGRGDLLEQEILDENNNLRVTSNNAIDPTHKGWYIDLIVNGNAEGERVVSNLIYRDNKIIFTTIIPSDDPCDYGGESWLMEVAADGGGRLAFSPFDLNGDNEFDADDNVDYNDGSSTQSVPPSGKKSEVGLVPAPAILNAGDKEFKYLPGSSGGIQKITENPGPFKQGRQSWRQLK